jgi:ubiquinone/menaquinone biosynthesis C-methylase UbiE
MFERFVRRLKGLGAPHPCERRIEELQTKQQALEARFAELKSNFVAQSLKIREQAILAQQRRLARTIRHAARPAAPFDRSVMLAKLAERFPLAFPLWQQLFENGRREYEIRPTTSLSVMGNPGARAFRQFLSIYLEGHVLDIGCGPQAMPLYFEGYDIERLAGIDPLPGVPHRNFEFVEGFAEFLPWPDGEFDTVTVATSLDHVLCLDMVLSEIRRVLRPSGRCVIWVGFIPGSPRYDPNAVNIEAIDQYHIFHFDRDWFLDLMAKYFTLEEEFPFEFGSYFYAFTQKSILMDGDRVKANAE